MTGLGERFREAVSAYDTVQRLKIMIDRFLPPENIEA